MYDKLPPGLYDLIQTEALKAGITDAALVEFCQWRELDREQTFIRLVQHMARVLSASLTEILNDKKPEEWQKSIANWLKNLPEEEKLEIRPQ